MVKPTPYTLHCLIVYYWLTLRSGCPILFHTALSHACLNLSQACLRIRLTLRSGYCCQAVWNTIMRARPDTARCFGLSNLLRFKSSQIFQVVPDRSAAIFQIKRCWSAVLRSSAVENHSTSVSALCTQGRDTQRALPTELKVESGTSQGQSGTCVN